MLLPPSLYFFSRLTKQKWEAKLLESRVADFIQAAPPDDVESDSEAPLAAASNGANGANGNQRPASLDNEPFGYSGAIAAGQPGLALPIQPTRPPGLVLPGMQNGQGYGQGVQVKQEEDPMRIRGGAVRNFLCLSVRTASYLKAIPRAGLGVPLLDSLCSRGRLALPRHIT